VGYSRADLEDMDIKDFNEILEYKKLLCCKNIVPPEYRFEGYTNPDESKLLQTVCAFIYIQIYKYYFTQTDKYILIYHIFSHNYAPILFYYRSFFSLTLAQLENCWQIFGALAKFLFTGELLLPLTLLLLPEHLSFLLAGLFYRW
jgi:hypothetical protein